MVAGLVCKYYSKILSSRGCHIGMEFLVFLEQNTREEPMNTVHVFENSVHVFKR